MGPSVTLGTAPGAQTGPPAAAAVPAASIWFGGEVWGVVSGTVHTTIYTPQVLGPASVALGDAPGQRAGMARS